MDNITSEDNYSIIGKTLVFLPGSFKPPHKGHWTMVTDNINLADEIHIFISNTSETYISNRKLSLTNLKQLAKIYKFAVDNKLNIAEIDDIFDELTDNANEISFTILKEKLNQVLNINIENVDYELEDEFHKMINDYLTDLQTNLFKSVRYTAAGKCIEPETAAEIFNLYIQDYGYSTDKVIVHICNNPSPITAAVGFANHQCKDCTIYVGSKTVDEEAERGKAWEQTLKGFDKNPTNKILLLPTADKIQAARDIRSNINNLTKDMFPEKITDETFNKIKELLTENVYESKFNQLYNNLINELKQENNLKETLIAEESGIGKLIFNIDSTQPIFDHDWVDQLRLNEFESAYGGMPFKRILTDHILRYVNHYLMDNIIEDFGKDYTKYEIYDLTKDEALQFIERFNEIANDIHLHERLYKTTFELY